MMRYFPYVLIAILLGLIVYLVYFYDDGSNSREVSTSPSTISVSEATVTTNQDDSVEVEDATPSVSLLAISGTLVRFEEEEVRPGEVVVFALLDDGTEFIRIDMRDIVQPGVSAPQDQLGLTLGQQVIVRGELEGDSFKAVSIE